MVNYEEKITEMKDLVKRIRGLNESFLVQNNKQDNLNSINKIADDLYFLEEDIKELEKELIRHEVN